VTTRDGPGDLVMVARPRRRSRARWPVVAVVVALLVAVAVVMDAPWATSDGAPVAAPTVAGSGAPPARDIGGRAAPQGAVLARVDGLVLRLPAERAVLVGFHEAGDPAALALPPAVPLLADLTSRTVEADVAGQDRIDDLGVQAVVLPSRGRAAPPTSALDVVLPADAAVRSPVDGEVVEVGPYRLYGRHDDTRVVLRPDAAPHLRVVLLHLRDVAVSVGDRVVAGETVLANRAASLPVRSQIDRFTRRSVTEDPRPHVHVEVRDPTS
jgi:murein DD-endopeptidase MepM/ murein hydrolase activator NlpD